MDVNYIFMIFVKNSSRYVDGGIAIIDAGTIDAGIIDAELLMSIF